MKVDFICSGIAYSAMSSSPTYCEFNIIDRENTQSKTKKSKGVITYLKENVRLKIIREAKPSAATMGYNLKLIRAMTKMTAVLNMVFMVHICSKSMKEKQIESLDYKLVEEDWELYTSTWLSKEAAGKYTEHIYN